MKANDHNDLAQYYGTEGYTKYLGGVLLTDGAVAFAEKFECYWLLDIICSYQNELMHEQDFQTWKIKRTGDKATVTAEDGNHNILCQMRSKKRVYQEIPYTDFQPDEGELWYEGGVILLPSEH